MTDGDSLSGRIRQFVAEPDMFFQQLAASPVKYRWPLAIVLAAGLCSGITTWLIAGWMMPAFVTAYSAAGNSDGFFSTLNSITIMFATLCAVAGPFVILTGAAAGFYILAGFVSRTGSFPHMISAIGWGMVPLAIYEAVRIPLLLAYLPGMSLTVSSDLFTLYKSSPFAFSSGSAALADMFTYNQVFYSVAVANAILHVLAYFACAWFWVPAVRHTCAVKYRHAVVIVLIPLLLFLVLSFGSGLISGHFSV